MNLIAAAATKVKKKIREDIERFRLNAFILNLEKLVVYNQGLKPDKSTT